MLSKMEKLKKLSALSSNTSTPSPVSRTHSSAASGAVKVKVLSPVSTLDGKKSFHAYVLKSDSPRIPDAGKESIFQLAPLLDEKGGVRVDKNKNRKPLVLTEFAMCTVKLNSSPNGPSEWATPKELQVGATVTLNASGVSEQFKVGPVIAGDFESSKAPEVEKKPLDFEAPALSIELICNDKKIAHRNATLSMSANGPRQMWDAWSPTDPTKLKVKNVMDETRGALLKPAGKWASSMEIAAEHRDDKEFKTSVLAVKNQLIDNAVYQSEGLGIQFQSPSHGPAMLLPVQGLDPEVQTPGDGKAPLDGEIVAATDQGCDRPIVESMLAKPPDDGRKEFGRYFNDTGVKTGGPWVKVPMSMIVMVPEGMGKFVTLDNCIELNLSLMDMPAHLGSSHVHSIRAIMNSFLCFISFVAFFHPNLEEANNDYAPSVFAKVPVLDFHTALLKNGIQVDADMVIELFKEKGAPLKEEDEDASKCFRNKPQPVIKCGFVNINENQETWDPAFILKTEDQTNKILAHEGREQEEAKIVAVAIDPRGVESHKASLEKLKEVDLAERIGKVDADWLFYFVLKVEEKKSAPAEEVKSDEEVPAESVDGADEMSGPSEPPEEGTNSEEEEPKEEPPPAKKPKTVKNKDAKKKKKEA